MIMNKRAIVVIVLVVFAIMVLGLVGYSDDFTIFADRTAVLTEEEVLKVVKESRVVQEFIAGTEETTIHVNSTCSVSCSLDPLCDPAPNSPSLVCEAREKDWIVTILKQNKQDTEATYEYLQLVVDGETGEIIESIKP